ncbi:MAG: V-type ATP synthase subunit E [Methanosarcinaceae archaeon]|nr:V-type ATP synthase subunit E [Methanosarcinaceae archaeon]
MGLETVVKDILDVAHNEASKINADADAEVSRIIDEARQTAKKIMGESLSKAEDDIKKMRQQETSSSNLEVKRAILNARKEVLESVYMKAVGTIAVLPPSKNEELLKAIIETQQINGSRIYSNRDSEEITKKLSTLDYAGNINCIGGVVIENEDGTIRLDYTYDLIMKNMNDQSLKQLSDILFG